MVCCRTTKNYYHQSHEHPDIGITQSTAFLLPTEGSALRIKTSRGSRSLANLLSEEFEQKIRQGLLNEGDKLPTESELVRSYDVVHRGARSPVQAASQRRWKRGTG